MSRSGRADADARGVADSFPDAAGPPVLSAFASSRCTSVVPLLLLARPVEAAALAPAPSPRWAAKLAPESCAALSTTSLSARSRVSASSCRRRLPAGASPAGALAVLSSLAVASARPVTVPCHELERGIHVSASIAAHLACLGPCAPSPCETATRRETLSELHTCV